jgi:uncharacterized protein YodC (DUF2158 family)
MSYFRRGDNVVLKSGGPTMTVNAVERGKVIAGRGTNNSVKTSDPMSESGRCCRKMPWRGWFWYRGAFSAYS